MFWMSSIVVIVSILVLYISIKIASNIKKGQILKEINKNNSNLQKNYNEYKNNNIKHKKL